MRSVVSWASFSPTSASQIRMARERPSPEPAASSTPESMMRCTCLSGTPVTHAASFADNAELIMAVPVILPRCWKEYSE